MKTYNAGTFTDLSSTPFGLKLWEFLNQNDNLIRMETASYLKRPALEPLTPMLIGAFGDEISKDRCKQMAGSMVRQIMEARGYTLEKKGVAVRMGGLFSTAARYGIELGSS